MQFSLKQLFVSITLIAIGFASLLWASQLSFHAPKVFWMAALFWIGGGMTVGVGALAPFKLKRMGAIVGFLVQIALAATYLGIYG
jgi:hypothetical protein